MLTFSGLQETLMPHQSWGHARASNAACRDFSINALMCALTCITAVHVRLYCLSSYAAQ